MSKNFIQNFAYIITLVCYLFSLCCFDVTKVRTVSLPPNFLQVFFKLF